MTIEVDLPGGHVWFTGCEGAPVERHANRERLAAATGRRLLWGTQVHGTTVLRDAEPGAEADGQITATDAAPFVFSADCVPVALAGPAGVGMLHSGWQGLAAGLIGVGVAALGDVRAAAIGPCARGCCYEVGEEVHETFATYDARRGQNLALEVVAAAQLRAAGVTRIEDAGICTICDTAYFSHRRQGAAAGRNGSLVWRA
ncbi:MAG: purine-nucleoside/S-methyl-5-thioadenosine phosphorylase / adenosine deaminase [Solirubrobacteraceae bacterium]|jgi:YfiH family protein|nr:purine-nucleoside/S-methyl-5-thioadenosine phosphorylase / adenosine deaminase [Solirubrobacteraceae bacterium]